MCYFLFFAIDMMKNNKTFFCCCFRTLSTYIVADAIFCVHFAIISFGSLILWSAHIIGKRHQREIERIKTNRIQFLYDGHLKIENPSLKCVTWHIPDQWNIYTYTVSACICRLIEEICFIFLIYFISTLIELKFNSTKFLTSFQYELWKSRDI